MFEELEEKYDIKYYAKDAALISYPKSGRTWLRMILAKILVNMGESCEDYEMLPSFHKHPDHMRHIYPDIESAKIVFLHRHPGDVAVSFHADHNALAGQAQGMNISDFIRMEEAGVPANIGFNNWWALAFTDRAQYEKHLKQVLFKQNNGIEYGHPVKFDNYLYISYEQMKKDIFSVIVDVVHFLEIKCTEGHIRDAIEYSKFENMKKIELEQDPELPNLLKKYKGQFGKMKDIYDMVDGEPILRDKKRNVRVRVGKTKNYLNVLSVEDIEYVHKMMDEESFIRPSNYEL